MEFFFLITNIIEEQDKIILLDLAFAFESRALSFDWIRLIVRTYAAQPVSQTW